VSTENGRTDDGRTARQHTRKHIASAADSLT